MARALKRILEERDIDASVVAEATDIGRSTISNYAAGRTSMSQEKVEAVARFLKLKAEEISKQEDEAFREVPAAYGRELTGLAAFKTEVLFETAISLLKDDKQPAWERATIAGRLLQEIADRKEP